MALALDGIAPLLQVLDMARSVAFYRDVLGFAVMATAPHGAAEYDWCMLALGEIAIMLDCEQARAPGAVAVAGPAPGEASRISLYFGCPDVDVAHAVLLARGWPSPPPVTTSYGMRQLIVRDPDGFQHPV